MKINLNDLNWDEFDELPEKEKIKKKPKKDNPELNEKDTYKKKRKKGDDLDVLF